MKKLTNMRHSAASLVVAAALLPTCASTASAQSSDTPTGITIPSSSLASGDDAGAAFHTNLQILGSGEGMSGTPLAFGPPFAGLFYETPASIACIYGLQPAVPGCNPYVVTANPKGGKKAIAIVDAFDDPNAFADLQYFSAQFGVAPITPSTFQVVFAPHGALPYGTCVGPATTPPSAKGLGWDVEESLDIEWAHAMAPGATLYLVEAQSNSGADLFCAVTVASGLVSAAGGGQISMSWGGGEFPGEVTVDHVFTAPNVVYYASSGDSAGAFYPSASPNVVSVGGTSLRRNATTGNFFSEVVWQNTGGAPSRFEPRPTYQNGISGIVGAHRGTPDIASDANPFTGVWVFDSLTFGRPVWFIVGGTSVSSPTWAGIANAAGAFAASSQALLTHLYGASENFHDVTSGICGPYMSLSAGEGWDFCTGLGGPRQRHEGDD
jgi:kumamolisin